MDTGDSLDRRRIIASAAIAVVAESGARGLTHRAVDRRAGLPSGSTSYYLRTRRALVEAVGTELAARSRESVDAIGLREPQSGEEVDLRVAAGLVAAYLRQVLTVRRGEVMARHALSLEVRDDPELHRLLATGLFSVTLAETLLRSLGASDPTERAADLVSFAEGLVLDHLIGPRSLSPAAAEALERQLARSVAAFLEGAAHGG